MKNLKEIIDYLKLRHRAKKADYYAHITNGICFRFVPPSFTMLHGIEATWREIERQEDEAMAVIEAYDKDIAADIREFIMKDRAERAEKKRLKEAEQAALEAKEAENAS